MDLSGFDFDKDKVLLEMSESHMEYLQGRWQDITRYDTPTTAEDDKGTATTSGKRSDDNDSLFRFAAQHISCSFSDVNWKYEQVNAVSYLFSCTLPSDLPYLWWGWVY